MPIIIDGWNLIRCDRSPLWDKESLAAARSLIFNLQGYQKNRKDPMILVFDSKNEYLDIPYTNTDKLTIVPTPDADAYIKRLIDNVPIKQRNNYRVVSSDKAVYLYARGSYANVMKCEEFWKKLTGR